jgi:oligopeptide/dipeptide ABC transporter, ATP-binding protein, C-terminal domain
MIDRINEHPLVQVRNLTKRFAVSGGVLTAVNNLNLDIYKGETLGLVGESGCGKSTAGRAILQMYSDGQSGEVIYNGQNISKLSQRELKPLRREMQLIFQDPYASLNGRMTVASIIAEPLNIHNIGTPAERMARVEELLQLVGLNSEHRNRFPHEFSGGQRQRICIARALAARPQFVVCDEPISALDVSIQAQVVNLMKELQAQMGLTYLFIAHDLSMVRYISDRILVMYLGNMAELAESDALNANPLHPYTQALLAAVPVPDPEHPKDPMAVLQGEIPSPLNPPSGCVFRTRCPKAHERCKNELPAWHQHTPGHYVACHLYT